MGKSFNCARKDFGFLVNIFTPAGSRGSYQFKPERERSKSENHNPISITHPHVYTGIGGLFIVYVGSLLGLSPPSFLDPIS